MSFVSTQNGSEHNAHEDSPVCSVLRRYFASQQARENEIERQRGAASQLHVAGDLTGGNDVVQEG